jgi:RIO kinase 1
MSYIGAAQKAAPPLHEVDLAAGEAGALFGEVLRNVELMLQLDLIHGDLSAYNILYAEGKITLIDFPQVVNGRTNPKAHFILERDIRRTCEYFVRQGMQIAPAAIVNDLWLRYFALAPQDQAADESRLDVAGDDLVAGRSQ